MKTSIKERVFCIFNYKVLILVIILTLYPFVYVLSASISSGEAVATGKVLLFPKEINFKAYDIVLKTKGLWMAYANTFFYTIVGTAVSMILTVPGAYALSKKRLMGRGFFTFFVSLTMWFNAGIIPFYLNMKSLSLVNKRWGIVIAFACSAFYMILLRTSFESLPSSMEESAKINGANDIYILANIYMPLSVPALLTVWLYYAIERWNGFFWAMILLSDKNKIPLQVLLKKLVVEMSINTEFISILDKQVYIQETIIYATIIISIIPIVAVYPYIQKYFVKGIMIGSIKG